jgi:peptidoglycan/xylan/chitin deacetylase (PgdA/CDA1 family)
VRQAAELENSRAVLQAASGQSVAGFCYPYGDADPRGPAAMVTISPVLLWRVLSEKKQE